MNILIVEDEAALAGAVEHILQKAGNTTDWVADGQTALDYIRGFSYDLVLLDIMLPRLDGLSVLRQIRREGIATPVLMLTARTTVPDKVTGLNAGADDYLTKPFNILELKARIRALLRRAGAGEKPRENKLVGGSITLDLDARNAYKGSELVVLTAKEFDVVEFLMRNAGKVYSREALLDTIWAYEYRSDIRTVDVHIRRLREKLEENPAEPQHILTKWGVGYYFRK